MSAQRRSSGRALGVAGALAGLALLACSLGGGTPATETPVPSPTSTTTATATATATAAPTDTAPAPTDTAAPSATPAPVILLAIVGPDKKIGLVTFDGQSLPLAQAPGNLYALAARSTDPAADSKAYAIGPAGVKELTFVNHSSDGFASFTGASAPQGEVAWDHWAANAVSGTLDSDIFLANTDGSGLHSVLKLTSDHVLHAVRFSPDGQSLYYSQEPLGLGGYIPFSGVSDLFVLDLASGASSQLVPDAAAGVICLDDFAPDASLVALHCNAKTIDVLDTTTGSIGQISAPDKVTDWQLHGDARLSPDQTRVAYALVRGDTNNEQGWVAVSDSLSGTSHLVATAPAGEYYSVKGWLNASTLVLQSWGTQPGVWVVQADGSDLRRLADGIFLGGS